LGNSESNDYGVKKISLFHGNDFFVTLGGIKYYLDLRIQSRNDEDKNDEGIHWLEFATEEAYNSKYFTWYSSPGIYVQTSPEKRNDIIIVNSEKLDYKAFNRNLTVDDFLTFVSEDDDFNRLIKTIGEPNAVDNYFGNNYFELANKQFVVCSVGKWADEGKIKYMYVADEEQELYTLWLAKDMVKILGKYMEYTSTEGRKLSEGFFKSFIVRSKSRQELVHEIGEPNINKDFTY
jgi:hypothetical protein